MELFSYIVILLSPYMLAENLMQILGNDTFVVGSGSYIFGPVIFSNLKLLANI